MRETVRTLLIDSNGLTWKSIFADTILKGILGLSSSSPLGRRLEACQIGQALLGERNKSLSYVLDWREAICERNELDVEVCNITNLVESRKFFRKLRQYPLIIVLHSIGDNMSLLLNKVGFFQERRGKIVFFVGNEYNLLDDKIGFLKSVKADFICSQLPVEAAQWLYEECADSKVLLTPHALNPRVYFPIPDSARTIDIGFIGDFYHYLTGDTERTHLVQFFQQHGRDHELTCGLRTKRLPRTEWAQFLRTCHGILGAESGTYYLDRTGQKIKAAKEYVRSHSKATFPEVYEKFFKNSVNPISGKAISSRHFEPIGTKTCQILIEGHYNGILKPDEHYISVKKDLSNIEEVIRRFKDVSYRTDMVEKTYEFIIASHTYKHRVETLLKTVLGE
jgi:hypothetical protein